MPGPGSPEPGASGPGGGDVGAVLLSPCIAPGTVSQTPYNHYTMLGSVENLFGLSHLGYAGLPGETYFGADIFNRSCGASTHRALERHHPRATPGLGLLDARPDPACGGAAGASTPCRCARSTRARCNGGHWRLPPTRITSPSPVPSARPTSSASRRGSGPFATATTVVPSGTRVTHGRFTGPWRVVKRRGAWQQHAIQATSSGAALTLRYVGGALSVIGETTATGGLLRVTLDGRSRTLHLHSRRLRRRRVIYTSAVAAGVHHLKLVDVRGLVALEGLAIASRTG